MQVVGSIMICYSGVGHGETRFLGSKYHSDGVLRPRQNTLGHIAATRQTRSPALFRGGQSQPGGKGDGKDGREGEEVVDGKGYEIDRAVKDEKDRGDEVKRREREELRPFWLGTLPTKS